MAVKGIAFTESPNVPGVWGPKDAALPPHSPVQRGVVVKGSGQDAWVTARCFLD